MKKTTYKTSGVDIEKANTFVNAIKGLTSSTKSSAVLSRKGSFGALYNFDKKKYKEPVLVSSTDGVGTKLLIANLVDKHDTVGIDLVGMNVNDILCVGAKPLFFLDYIACGKLDPKTLKSVVRGIAKGCKESGCSLIGGETAEMPGMYKSKDYDLAGFAVGVVDKDKILDGSAISAGDYVIGLASSGLHSNGFSLVRKVFSKSEQKKYGKELLKPTKIYVKPVLSLLEKFSVNGIAHVTGGAFYDKLTKVLPKGKCFVINQGTWPIPKIFKMIQKKGKISDQEMFRTFNMGIGLAVVINKRHAKKAITFLKTKGIKAHLIGKVVNDKRRIIFA